MNAKRRQGVSPVEFPPWEGIVEGTPYRVRVSWVMILCKQMQKTEIQYRSERALQIGKIKNEHFNVPNVQPRIFVVLIHSDKMHKCTLPC